MVLLMQGVGTGQILFFLLPHLLVAEGAEQVILEIPETMVGREAAERVVRPMLVVLELAGKETAVVQETLLLEVVAVVLLAQEQMELNQAGMLEEMVVRLHLLLLLVHPWLEQVAEGAGLLVEEHREQAEGAEQQMAKTVLAGHHQTQPQTRVLAQVVVEVRLGRAATAVQA
jgi:hypothetical protein